MKSWRYVLPVAVTLLWGCQQNGELGSSDAPGDEGAGGMMSGAGGAAGAAGGGGTGGTGNRGGIPPDLVCDTIQAGVSPLRRLTRTEYDNAIRDLLGLDLGLAQEGFPADEQLGGYDANGLTPVAELNVEQYMEAAEQIAVAATGRLDRLLPCGADARDEACALTFVEALAHRAWRLPIEGDLRSSLVNLYRAGAQDGGLEAGLRRAIAYILQSPLFTYVVERGSLVEGQTDVERLDALSLATRLSLFLWASVPDDALLDAATSGALDTPEGIRAQVTRMIADERIRGGLAAFHSRWLDVEALDYLEKDTEAHPEFDVDVREAMRLEFVDFIDAVIRGDDPRLETLLTAPFTFIDRTLAPIYGLIVPGETFDVRRLEAEDVGSPVGGRTGGGWNVWSNGALEAEFNLPEGGVYRFHTEVQGQQAGPEFVEMAIEIDGERILQQTLETSEPVVLTVQAELAGGQHTMGVWFLNDFNSPDQGDRNLVVDWLSAEGPYTLADGAEALLNAEPGERVRIELDPERRSGVLTLPAVLATHAKANQSNPVTRGKFIRERLFCQGLPPPPPDVQVVAPEIEPGVSTRDRFTQHMEDIACIGCHSLMDPVGFAFEHFDAVGAWRDEDQGHPVDASGELVATRDADGTFVGAPQLAGLLVGSQEVEDCVTLEWTRYALRRLESDDDLCSLVAIREAFVGADRDLRVLMRAIAVSDAFRHRKVEE